MNKKCFNTKVVELFGLPKTGKTTAVTALKKHLVNKGRSVEVIKERASLCPIKDKLYPTFNFWTAISFMKEYIEANDRSVDIVLADRGILDSYVWINLFTKRENIVELYDCFKKMVDQECFLDNYIMSFYFSASVDIVLERERERQISKTLGRIMNRDILSMYIKSYNEIEVELRKISDITVIDSNINSIEDVLKQISSTIDAIL